MITSPTGKGVILLGCCSDLPRIVACDHVQDTIYQMALDSNGSYTWTKMKQKLKYSTTWEPIVEYIDDKLVTCS